MPNIGALFVAQLVVWMRSSGTSLVVVVDDDVVVVVIAETEVVRVVSS